MTKNISWLLLFLALVWPLLFTVGCRDRDGLVDAGPVVIDAVVLPDGFRPDPRL